LSLPREKPIPEIGSVIASQFASTVTTTSNAKLKINALKKAKISIADYPYQIPDLIKKAMTDKFLTKSVS
jgi:succinyl-CoA synthetase alpha subunit